MSFHFLFQGMIPTQGLNWRLPQLLHWQVGSLPHKPPGKPSPPMGGSINAWLWWSEGLTFWTVVLEKTLASPLDCREIQPVHSEGDQPWDFFGRNDAKAETPVLWPPRAKSWLIGKDSDAGRDWGQEKGTTEDEMAGWHHWLNGCESQWTLGVGVGQGVLACCNSWGRKESDTTERLIWSDLIWCHLKKRVLGRLPLSEHCIDSRQILTHPPAPAPHFKIRIDCCLA